MPPVDNSRYLKADAAARHLDCVARVMAAIENAKRDGAPLTVSGIARQAGVSRTFLHDLAQRDLLDCMDPDPKKSKALDRAYVGGRRVRAYIFTSATLDGPDNDEDRSGQSSQNTADPTAQQEALPAPSAPLAQPPLDNG